LQRKIQRSIAFGRDVENYRVERALLQFRQIASGSVVGVAITAIGANRARRRFIAVTIIWQIGVLAAGVWK
jgi:hypothetical protein